MKTKFNLTSTLLPLLVAITLSPLNSHAGAPLPPPPVPTHYRFENDLLIETQIDANHDGKFTTRKLYEKTYLVQLEQDLDHDGIIDWRETWIRPKDAKP